MDSSTTQQTGSDTHSESPDNAVQGTEQLAEKKGLIENLWMTLPASEQDGFRIVSGEEVFWLESAICYAEGDCRDSWLRVDSEGNVRGPEFMLWALGEMGKYITMQSCMRPDVGPKKWCHRFCCRAKGARTEGSTWEEAVLRCYLAWKVPA